MKRIILFLLLILHCVAIGKAQFSKREIIEVVNNFTQATKFKVENENCLRHLNHFSSELKENSKWALESL